MNCKNCGEDFDGRMIPKKYCSYSCLINDGGIEQ